MYIPILGRSREKTSWATPNYKLIHTIYTYTWMGTCKWWEHNHRKSNSAHECVWTHCWKTYFKILKNSEKIAFRSGHFRLVHKFSDKRTYFVSHVIFLFIYPGTWLFTDILGSFYSFFRKLTCEHRVSRTIYKKN